MRRLGLTRFVSTRSFSAADHNRPSAWPFFVTKHRLFAIFAVFSPAEEYIAVMARMARTRNGVVELSPEVGGPANALKFSINLSAELGSELRRIAFEERVSESSVIEISLRQLFRRVSPDRLGVFLKQNGACLRRRS